MNQITEKQKKMYASRGHTIEVHLIGMEKVFVGKCTGFVSSLNNEPDGAAIYLKVPEMKTSMYEFTEDEIESIEIID